MTPAFIDELSWAMAEVYGATVDQILINIARHFPYISLGKEPKELFEYQARKLAEMGQVNRETIAIITRMLGGGDAALRETLESAIDDALKDVEPEMRKAAQAGITGTTSAPPVVAPNQMRAFKKYYDQSADKLNLVNTVMLESTQAAYAETVTDIVTRVSRTQGFINAATGETITGVSAWNEAMRNAVQRMADNGLTGFIDHAGKRWSPEAYVAMDIRTTAFNVARAATWERAEQYGTDIYQVSSHNGARPLCYPWQGRLISRNDMVQEVPDLDGNMVHVYAQSETSYGQAAGLFGINCGHYPIPFIPGFSRMRSQGQDKEANEKSYAESQQQRALERKLREERRDLEILKAQGADADAIKAQKARVDKADSNIREFCAETGRGRRRAREYTPIDAKFPPKDSFDPTTFPTEQRDTMREWFSGVAAPIDTAPQPAQHAFTPAKTRTEAEEYARQTFADYVNYTGINVENANKINETLTTLTEKYPIDRLDYISQKSIGAVARANHDHLEINGKKLGKTLNDEEINFKLGQAFAKNEAKQLREKFADKAKIPFAIQQKIDKLENGLKFTRYGVHSTYEDHVRTVITHEYGHILSDQYFGMINKERGNPNYATNWGLRGMNDKWKAAYNKALETGDIYGLSEYGSKNEREFFAESFAAREMGETLPDYVEALFREVFANGIM